MFSLNQRWQLLLLRIRRQVPTQVDSKTVFVKKKCGEFYWTQLKYRGVRFQGPLPYSVMSSHNVITWDTT